MSAELYHIKISESRKCDVRRISHFNDCFLHAREHWIECGGTHSLEIGFLGDDSVLTHFLLTFHHEDFNVTFYKPIVTEFKNVRV